MTFPTRDLAEANALVEANLALAYHVARRLYLSSYRVRRLGLPAANAAALYGLMRASRTYQPEKGAFSTHAWMSVRYHVLREAALILFPFHVPLYQSEAGGGMGVGRNAPWARDAALPTVDVYDLERADHGPIDPSPGPLERVIDREARSWAQSAIARRLRTSLPQRMREVIRLRFWEGWSLLQIGKHIGVTMERVRQVLLRAFYHLRQFSDLQEIVRGKEALHAE